MVVDESGKPLAPTYIRRAKGLVKNGRARWLDENTICLACPPDTLNLGDNEMENRTENMENIQFVSENQSVEAEPIGQEAVTVRDLLNRIDQIIAQGEQYSEVIRQIQALPVNESPCGGYDGAGRSKAIRIIYAGREVTNQKMIELLQRMYEDMPGSKLDETNRSNILDQLAKKSFTGVEPGTAKEIMDFYRELL